MDIGRQTPAPATPSGPDSQGGHTPGTLSRSADANQHAGVLASFKASLLSLFRLGRANGGEVYAQQILTKQRQQMLKSRKAAVELQASEIAAEDAVYQQEITQNVPQSQVPAPFVALDPAALDVVTRRADAQTNIDATATSRSALDLSAPGAPQAMARPVNAGAASATSDIALKSSEGLAEGLADSHVESGSLAYFGDDTPEERDPQALKIAVFSLGSQGKTAPNCSTAKNIHKSAINPKKTLKAQQNGRFSMGSLSFSQSSFFKLATQVVAISTVIWFFIAPALGPLWAWGNGNIVSFTEAFGDFCAFKNLLELVFGLFSIAAIVRFSTHFFDPK